MPLLRNFLVVAGAMTAIASAGQSKINPVGINIINEYRALQLDGLKMMSESSVALSYPAFVVLTDDSGRGQDAIRALGFEILEDYGDIVTVQLPVDRAEELSQLSEVRYVDFGQRVNAKLDMARPASHVTEAQDGFEFEGETISFDGTGVIAGMMDTGIEANHLNFKTPDGTGSRIKRLFWYQGNGGTPATYNESNVNRFTTDDQQASHATHVAGIMAGSYKGTATFATLPNASGNVATRKTGENPYYGVATGADLAFAVGPLYTANITGGVQHIVDYAEEVGQPCVVNLSLGSTNGPHDGTDAYSRVLGRLGQRAIICMSSGNDGDVNMSIVKEFTEGDVQLKTMLENNRMDGIIDIWGDDASVYEVSLGVYNTATRTFTVLAKATGANQQYTISTANNSTFNSGFQGSMQMVSQLNPLNNRYNVSISGTVAPRATSQTARLAVKVDGAAGHKLWVYGNSNTAFTSNSYIGWTTGSPSNSINDAVCGDNIVSVGAYTSRTSWPYLTTGGATAYSYNATFTLGGIAPFSSYGTSFQGRDLPMITAPGANIVSSLSRFYVTGQNLTGQTTVTARSGISTDYWAPMQGTSMSCPYVSGVIALWLQAKHGLDFEQVKEVLENSSDFSALTMRPAVKWGYGKINAKAGLEYILRNLSSIGEVWADDAQRLIVSVREGVCDVTLAGEASFEVLLRDIQGRTVATARGTDGAAQLETSALNAGVYVLTVNGASTTQSRKIALR